MTGIRPCGECFVAGRSGGGARRTRDAVVGARFLRIGINRRVSGPDMGAMLAHRLQHAVELAEAELRHRMGG